MRVNACVRACVCVCVSVCASRVWLCGGLTPDTGAAAVAPLPRGSVPRACLQWTVRAAAGSGVWAPRRPPARPPAPALRGRASGMERELGGLRAERERQPQFCVADGGALP